MTLLHISSSANAHSPHVLPFKDTPAASACNVCHSLAVTHRSVSSSMARVAYMPVRSSFIGAVEQKDVLD